MSEGLLAAIEIVGLIAKEREDSLLGGCPRTGVVARESEFEAIFSII